MVIKIKTPILYYVKIPENNRFIVETTQFTLRSKTKNHRLDQCVQVNTMTINEISKRSFPQKTTNQSLQKDCKFLVNRNALKSQIFKQKISIFNIFKSKLQNSNSRPNYPAFNYINEDSKKEEKCSLMHKYSNTKTEKIVGN